MSYVDGRMPLDAIERAMKLWPDDQMAGEYLGRTYQ